MSTRLVIPAGDSEDTVVQHYRPDPKTGEDVLVDKLDDDGSPLTWAEVARAHKVDAIEVFGSPWCVENGIDGLGICTEESGQESPAQVAAREATEAAAAVEAQARSEKEAAILATADRFDALVAKLETKAVLSKADADEVKGTATLSEPVRVKDA